MNDDKSWQKPLDKFLAESEMSIDNHVLARVLSGNDEQSNNHDIADIERALHIEENIAEIGLQPMPTNLAYKLQACHFCHRCRPVPLLVVRRLN